jgi:crossover junction endodeoxyribonuclease RuvC
MILGIDPGAKGALAFFDVEAGTLRVVDMPTVKVTRGSKQKEEISPQMLAAEIRAWAPRIAIVEKVGAMPGQGVSSMFQFGRGVGMIEGVLSALQIPVSYISPQGWQKAVGTRGGKDGNRARAAELFPGYADIFKRVKDDGRADASLLAWWAATALVSK